MANSNQQLLSKRVKNTDEININDFECNICHDLVWRPVACNTCEIIVCSDCIKTWLTINSSCPNKCESFKECKCSPLILTQIARLKIACINEPNGCSEVN